MLMLRPTEVFYERLIVDLLDIVLNSDIFKGGANGGLGTRLFFNSIFSATQALHHQVQAQAILPQNKTKITNHDYDVL